MAIGIEPFQLGDHRENWGAVPFKISVTTNATDSTYQLLGGGSGFNGRLRVIGFSGIMTAAGGAGDTVQLKDKDGTAISEAVDVSALSAGDKWDASVIDSTYYNVDNGDKLQVVTASAALCVAWAELMRVES